MRIARKSGIWGPVSTRGKVRGVRAGWPQGQRDPGQTQRSQARSTLSRHLWPPVEPAAACASPADRWVPTAPAPCGGGGKIKRQVQTQAPATGPSSHRVEGAARGGQQRCCDTQHRGDMETRQVGHSTTQRCRSAGHSPERVHGGASPVPKSKRGKSKDIHLLCGYLKRQVRKLPELRVGVRRGCPGEGAGLGGEAACPRGGPREGPASGAQGGGRSGARGQASQDSPREPGPRWMWTAPAPRRGGRRSPSRSLGRRQVLPASASERFPRPQTEDRGDLASGAGRLRQVPQEAPGKLQGEPRSCRAPRSRVAAQVGEAGKRRAWGATLPTGGQAPAPLPSHVAPTSTCFRLTEAPGPPPAPFLKPSSPTCPQALGRSELAGRQGRGRIPVH